MDTTPIVEAELAGMPICRSASQSPRPLAVWKRLLIASAVGIVLAVAGAGVWLFGILMFTFSLDGASSSQLPDWLEPLMLVGWPVSIGIAAVLPALLIACGVRWNRILLSFAASVTIAIAVYMTGIASVFASAT